jgi:DNA-binding MarR family transcriptional regulator
MSFLFGNKGKGGSSRIPANATFRLTQEGREKLQEFKGDPPSQILVTLETRGTSDADEISQASGLRKGEVDRHLPKLIKGGYIQYVSANADSGDE